jgi:hypothetical protein
VAWSWALDPIVFFLDRRVLSALLQGVLVILLFTGASLLLCNRQCINEAISGSFETPLPFKKKKTIDIVAVWLAFRREEIYLRMRLEAV